jgi:hypothetical protein
LTSVRRAYLAVALAVLAVSGGVVVSALPDCAEHCQTLAAAPQGAPQPSPTEPARLTIVPKPDAEVDPLARVMVTADTGTVARVTMLNDAGKEIPGVLTPDARTWKPTTTLGYGRTYTLKVDARGPGGMPTRKTTTFSTVTPGYQARVYLNGTNYAPLQDGATYGVGMVIVARFDEPITDKATAENRMKVVTEPKAVGSWNWIDDQTAHWRPEKYYAPGTKVTVDAGIYGAKLGDDLYGAQDEKVSFTIGASHVTVADDTDKQVKVYENGKLVRTMPTSMGMGGTETIGGTTNARRTVLMLRAVCRPARRQKSAQGAALDPFGPGHGPVAVVGRLERVTAGVADLDDVAGHREVVEPFGVLAVQVEAAVAGVGFPLRPHRRVELMQIDAVDADASGPRDGRLVAEP